MYTYILYLNWLLLTEHHVIQLGKLIEYIFYKES
jgi:hypothetical protein